MAENFFGKVMLAPMAGEGDYTFRASCKKFGADYLVSEMISAKAICYNDKKTPELLEVMAREEKIVNYVHRLFSREIRFESKKEKRKNRKIRGCTKAAGKNSRGRNCKNRNGDASALSCI